MTGPRRLLLVGLMAILIVLIVKAHVGTIWPPNAGVDVEIPLRAAERWMAGDAPYLAEAFTFNVLFVARKEA